METKDKNSELTKYKIICFALTIIILASIIDRIFPIERDRQEVIHHYDKNGVLQGTDTSYIDVK